MKEELYDAILNDILEAIGYRCQPSELQELAEVIVQTIRDTLSEELY